MGERESFQEQPRIAYPLNLPSTFLLARGNVDVLGLGRDIAEIDTTATFHPLQPLADNDVQGYLRHMHEQTFDYGGDWVFYI